MTQHNVDTLLDALAECIERKLAAIKSRAFRAGCDKGFLKGFWEGKQHAELPNIENEYYAYLEGHQHGYIKGLATGIGQIDIENEYYAYLEGRSDERGRDGHIKLYYNHKNGAIGQ